MKRFLQEVVWRLSLVAALLTCTALAAWGQEKVMHPVYTYTHGDIEIDCPTEIADGEDLYFGMKGGSGSYFTFVFVDGVRKIFESDGLEYISEENRYCLHNVTGPVLLEMLEETTCEVDGLLYKLSAWYNADLAINQLLDISSLELKNVITVGDKTYRILDYKGQFNANASIASITFPNSDLKFYSGSIDNQPGLREIHAKAIDPAKYDGIEEAFGNKDLSEVTLYVPGGCADLYAASAPWNRFKEIKEEGEIPTEYPVYYIGKDGVASCSPTTVKKGESFEVEYTVENGYYKFQQKPVTADSLRQVNFGGKG